MRKKGRIIAWILIMVLLCGQIPVEVFAHEGQPAQVVSTGNVETVSNGDNMQAALENSISMKGENSFGTMLASELSTEVLEQKQNNGCNVFSVEIQEDAAVVSFECVEDAVLVVGIYNETGTELLTSGKQEILAGETTAVVDFETNSIPQYFYIKAYLIEALTYRPLCTVYESPMYTQEMQEFLAKTTADFDEERVLNLDEDETNNFAVYSEETVLITGADEQNEVVRVDESNNVYLIEDADSIVKSLQPGDVFAYAYKENEVLIAKVASIDVNGNTVTITGEDTSMEEVFEYIKIDAEMGSGEATVDASSCDDGVTYEGLVDYVEEDVEQIDVLNAGGIETEGSVEKAFKMKLDKEFGSIDGINVNISGALEMKLRLSAKVYLTLQMQYLEVKFDYSAKVSANVTGKASAEIPLVTVGFMFTGIIVELTPSVVIDARATISVEGTLSGTVGFRAQVGSGITNLTTYPKFKTSLKVEGSILVGFSLCPRVKIISDKVASASLIAKVGAEVKASCKYPVEQDEKKKHTCTVCIAGEIYGKFNISAELKFLNSTKFTITPVDWSTKIFDFYYSADHDDFGLSTCPYYLLKGEIIVLENNWQPIQHAEIKTNDGIFTTNEDGRAEIWFSVGNHIFTVGKEGFKTVFRELMLRDGGEGLVVILEEKDIENEDSGAGDEGKIEQEKAMVQVKLGCGHSATSTEEGELYLWGYNYDNQLGDGTKKDSLVPKKIMNDVKEISLGGWHSAAITKEGDLYLWGNNIDGNLGDGTTVDSSVPKKIMSGVKAVSLGGWHSAAISEKGDLYLWGYNGEGQLGDGTVESSLVPKKIMSDVKAVSLGMRHSAAITEEGDLYLWGDNNSGKLGDGTTVDSSVPKKIMSGVKEVSLGLYHSAAITEEGDLYLWGSNECGQLGNGTVEDSSVPKKIMSGVKEVSLGYYHSVAITEEGDLYLWGSNECGQLGNGTVEDSSVPLKIMSDVKKVSLGGYHSAAITEEGEVYLWGDNSNGQLGNGATTASNIPIKINIPSTIDVTNEISLLSKDDINEIFATYEQQLNWNGTNFINLISNETYNYYVMMDRGAEQPFSTDNMIYIGQAVADENGTLNVAFSSEVTSAGEDIFVVPMHQMNLADAEVTVENLTYNGTEQYVNVSVSYQDAILEEGVDYNVKGDYGVTQIGDYTLTVEGIGLYTGTISASYQMLSNGKYNAVWGTVNSFGNETAQTTLRLLASNGTVVDETCITGNNTEYIMKNIPLGAYTMQVSKHNHVSREYTLVVGDEAVIQDVEIQLIGDINEDGKIDVADNTMLYNHIAFLMVLTDYDFAVADVNRDGRVNARDKKMIYNHIAGVSPLWQ